MVKLINKLTCGEMWVAEDRVEEYTAAGYKLAASSEKKTTSKPKAKKTKK